MMIGNTFTGYFDSIIKRADKLYHDGSLDDPELTLSDIPSTSRNDDVMRIINGVEPKFVTDENGQVWMTHSQEEVKAAFKQALRLALETQIEDIKKRLEEL